MPLVASVRLRYASQDYWFDPAGLDVKAGDHVLVETSKGTEIGLCTQDVVDVEEVELAKPLKPIIRIATEEDLEKADEIAARDQEALAVFHDLADKNHLDMSPSAVEFSFDESHATFYFTSDDRVDFRGLVRDLAPSSTRASTCARSGHVTRLACSVVWAIAARSCAAHDWVASSSQ